MHQMDQRPRYPRTRRPPTRRPTTPPTALNKSNGTQPRDPFAIRIMPPSTSPASGLKVPRRWMYEKLIPIQALWSAARPSPNRLPAMPSSPRLQLDRAYSSLLHLRSRTLHQTPHRRRLMECTTPLTSLRWRRPTRATCLRDKFWLLFDSFTTMAVRAWM